MRKLLAIVLAGSFAIAVVACGDDDGDGSGGGDGGSEVPEGDVTLVAEDFSFDPADLQAGPGQVTIAFQNGGNADHNITIESLDVDTDVEPGEGTTVDVNVPGGESVEFFCKFHESQGMVGTLTAGGTTASAPASTTATVAEEVPQDGEEPVPGY